MKLTAPKGTKDILPSEIASWEKIEKTAKALCSQYGFKQIRTPEFEYTDLFVRGVGEGTDIVKKEMYTFARNEKNSFTLKPEGTAPAIRAYIQNGMSNEPQPVKLFYLTSCYRAENPQKGRMRQFHQFGCELIGSDSPLADAQVIILADAFIKKMGVENVKLHINTVGCPKCRKEYYEILKKFLQEKREYLCEDCLSRMETNPMRVLDCKNEKCREALANAPLMKDHLCEDCEKHFETVKKALIAAGVEYELDAHTNTAFEFIAEGLGAQSTLCGGGRYNGLCAELGGDDSPGVGFALGIERLLLLLEEEKTDNVSDLYIAALGDSAAMEALRIQSEMIHKGLSVSTDVIGRSLKAQMKYADKLGAQFVLIIGEDELANGKYTLRNMSTKEQQEILPDELEKLYAAIRG